MPVEIRYYDADEDGTWLKLQSIEAEDATGVVDVHISDYDEVTTIVRLAADDVEKLIEELKQYLPKKPPVIFTTINSKVSPSKVGCFSPYTSPYDEDQ